MCRPTSKLYNCSDTPLNVVPSNDSVCSAVRFFRKARWSDCGTHMEFTSPTQHNVGPNSFLSINLPVLETIRLDTKNASRVRSVYNLKTSLLITDFDNSGEAKAHSRKPISSSSIRWSGTMRSHLRVSAHSSSIPKMLQTNKHCALLSGWQTELRGWRLSERLFGWMAEGCLKGCLADCLTEWLSDWMAVWLSGCLCGWLAVWLKAVAVWLSGCLCGWLAVAVWMAVCVADWLFDWRLSVWLSEWLSVWLIGCLCGWRLWLIGCLCGWRLSVWLKAVWMAVCVAVAVWLSGSGWQTEWLSVFHGNAITYQSGNGNPVTGYTVNKSATSGVLELLGSNIFCLL